MDIKKRLNAVIQKDKKTNPKFLANVLKSDFYYLISNYFEVEFDDINVQIGYEDEKYFIEVSCLGERVKMVRVLPQ